MISVFSRDDEGYVIRKDDDGTRSVNRLRHIGYYGRLSGSMGPKDAALGPDGEASSARDVPEAWKKAFLIGFGLLFISLSFLFDRPGDVWRGSIVILTSPANLLTDYIKLANTGAAFFNVGLMALLSAGLIHRSGAVITGPLIAGFFTVAGFSLFGKNLYNTLPIVLGIYLYARASGQPFDRLTLHCLLGTALSPLVSEFSFNLGLPLYLGMPMGVSAGALVGFALVPLSAHFFRIHQGHSLYNIGFTAGIIGMLFTAALRGFGIEISTLSILSSGNNAAFAAILFGISAVMLILGLLLIRGDLRGYKRLLSLSGTLPTDFPAISGMGHTLINMALMGILSTAYVLLLGGELSGPVIGGILTVVGFAAFGKHPRNALPVMAGVFLVNVVGIGPMNAPLALMGALFGTTLAPLAGRYGILAGVLAGALHMLLVGNVSFLHAGMNLYNNGFSGGFIAAALFPLLETLRGMREARKIQKAGEGKRTDGPEGAGTLPKRKTGRNADAQ